MTTSPLVEKFGRRVRARRLAHNWSQAALAGRVGVSQAAISYWETGERWPGLDELLALVLALDIDICELLPALDAPDPEPGPYDMPLELVAMVHAVAQRHARETEDVRLNGAVDAAMAAGFRLGVAHGLSEAAALINDLPAATTNAEAARVCREQHKQWHAVVVNALDRDLSARPDAAVTPV